MTRPVFFFDDACGFCRRWVTRWRARVNGRVRFVPRSDVLARWRFGVSRRATRRSSILIDRGRVFSGSDAVFRLFRWAPGLRAIGLIGLLPGVRHLANPTYRFIARHRVAAARLDHLLLGNRRAAPNTTLVRWLFLRLLGLIFLAAFASLRRQALGLYGRDGIYPLAPLLRAGAERRGWSVLRRWPSLLWFGASDRQIDRLLRAGELASAALAVNLAPRLSLLTAWAGYLSFVSVGGDFLSFQWDSLLLETGASALLLTPGGVLPGIGRGRPPAAATWLMRWLAFRLHFESGIAKWQSGDRSWRTGTACCAYYETAPLPTPLGWHVHHLPRWFQKFSTAAVLVLEGLVPWLALMPRRPRRWAFAKLLFLQAAIFATGNYGFFNLLSAVDLLWLLDDEDLWTSWARAQPPVLEPLPRRVVATAGAAGLFTLSAVLLAARTLQREPGPRASRLLSRMQPFLLVNQYGLFSVMTTRRPEILVEGSMDGQEWRPYEFRYKPGDPRRGPRLIAPHLPRLDWLLWFAALGDTPAWFGTFLVRLLQGSPHVVGLLGRSPFSRPARFVRASLYEYRMTSEEVRRRTGLWWRREFVGPFFPAIGRAEAPASP